MPGERSPSGVSISGYESLALWIFFASITKAWRTLSEETEMTSRIGQKRPALLLMGYGAAGRAYAEGFAAFADVTACDPAAEAGQSPQGVHLRTEMPQSVDAFDLVIILTPAAASKAICQTLSSRSGSCPVLDLTSSDPAAMRSAAALLGARFVDGAVMGAVGLTGLATPMVLAGPMAQQVVEILTPFGCKIVCLDAEPGAASTTKLLRSLFMKGLEALVVEAHLTAHTLGQSDSLSLALADLRTVNILDLMAEMLRTHPRHAARRLHEIEAAAVLMRAAQMQPVMTQAAHTLFDRTANAGIGPDDSPQVALQWLSAQIAPEQDAVT